MAPTPSRARACTSASSSGSSAPPRARSASRSAAAGALGRSRTRRRCSARHSYHSLPAGLAAERCRQVGSVCCEAQLPAPGVTRRPIPVRLPVGLRRVQAPLAPGATRARFLRHTPPAGPASQSTQEAGWELRAGAQGVRAPGADTAGAIAITARNGMSFSWPRGVPERSTRSCLLHVQSSLSTHSAARSSGMHTVQAGGRSPASRGAASRAP